VSVSAFLATSEGDIVASNQASAARRQRELARQRKRREKLAERKARREEKAETPAPLGEDPMDDPSIDWSEAVRETEELPEIPSLQD
jgi:hypothetical protein